MDDYKQHHPWLASLWLNHSSSFWKIMPGTAPKGVFISLALLWDISGSPVSGKKVSSWTNLHSMWSAGFTATSASYQLPIRWWHSWHNGNYCCHLIIKSISLINSHPGLQRTTEKKGTTLIIEEEVSVIQGSAITSHGKFPYFICGNKNFIELYSVQPMVPLKLHKTSTICSISPQTIPDAVPVRYMLYFEKTTTFLQKSLILLLRCTFLVHHGTIQQWSPWSWCRMCQIISSITQVLDGSASTNEI